METGFSLCVGLGASLGMWKLAVSLTEKDRWNGIHAGLGILAVMLAGARLAYVLLHGVYYQAHPEQAAAFWQGGLLWQGALIGWLVGAALTALITRANFLRTCDRFSELLLPTAAGVLIACWLNGELTPKFPALLFILLFVIFGMILEQGYPTYSRMAGHWTTAVHSWLSLFCLLVLALSQPDVPVWGILRADIWAAGGYFLVVLPFTVWFGVKSKPVRKGEKL